MTPAGSTANIATHEYGMSLLKASMRCSEIAQMLNISERDLLQYRTFGYGHSFGLSHYYGRDLELREDIDTGCRYLSMAHGRRR